MMIAYEVTATGPRPWMLKIVKRLLDQKLVACAQISEIDSYYWWEGTVEQAEEVRVTFHTAEKNVPVLITRIEADHPYVTPCVFAVHLKSISASYLQWIDSTVVDVAGKQED